MGAESEESDITIHGPDNAELRLFPHGEFYLWKIRNGGLNRLENVRLEVDGIQTFDSEKLAFRESDAFKFPWPVIRTLRAGDETKSFIFVRFEDDHPGFGDSLGMNFLFWPNGDRSEVRCWRLSMKVTGLSEEWPIQLCLRWTTGTRTRELKKCSSPVPEVSGETGAAMRPKTEQRDKGKGFPVEFRTVNPERAAQPLPEWSDLTVTFISDERVNIKFSGADSETRNYEEMGFGDGRGGKPRAAWLALRAFSGNPSKPLRIDKKRAQEIRALLKKQFLIDSDPLLFEKGLGYLTRFKICRGGSFDS